MKNIIKFLEENNIDYECVKYGNPYYYNDGFSVQAVSVKFDYDFSENITELKQKEDTFLKYMKRKKRFCIGYSGKCGLFIPWYAVFDTDDFEKLKEHEKRIQTDVEKFWKGEHEKRINDGMNTAMKVAV